MYTQYDNDAQPLPPGVLDDPVFAKLPPKPGGVTYGRYLPPTPAAQPVQPVQPEPAKQSAGKGAGKPAPATPITAQPVEPASAPAPLKPASKASPAPSTPEPLAPVVAAVGTPSQPVDAFTQPEPSAQEQRSFRQLLSTDQNLHLLLIGNDEAKLGQGRADVLMVVTLDAVHKQMSLLSIPRDTRVNLPGHGWIKINAAYAYGGASLQTKAVERFLGIPMDKIVEVSFTGFQQAMNAVGGVSVNPAFAFTLEDQSFAPGLKTLNGAAALAYTRMRKDDPEGDLGRNRRQQEVIRSLIAELGKVPSSEFLTIMDTLKHSVRTDFTPSEVLNLRTARPYLLTKQTRVAFSGKNKKIGGVWFYLIGDRERQRLHLLLR